LEDEEMRTATCCDCYLDGISSWFAHILQMKGLVRRLVISLLQRLYKAKHKLNPYNYMKWRPFLEDVVSYRHRGVDISLKNVWLVS